MRKGIVALMLICMSLVACGGGGGGGTGGNPPPPAMTTSFTLSANSASFSGIQNSAAPAPQSFTINVTGDTTVAITASMSGGASQPGWLTFTVTGSGATRTLTIAVNTASMATGQSTAGLVISATDSSGTLVHQESFSVALTVTLAVTPATMGTNPASLAFAGPNAGPVSLPLQINVAVSSSSNDTATTTYPFTAVVSTDTGQWLTVDQPTGTFQLGTGATLNVGVNVAGISSGTHSGEVTVTAIVDGVPVSASVPVTLTVKENRLVVTAMGVGFSQVGSTSVLTRTVQVLSNIGRTDIPWTATSDSPWLTVTQTGMTGGNLVLTADPTGAPQNVPQYANVTIASSDSSVLNQQTVRVGLYVSSTPAASAAVTTAATNLSASPVDPVVAISTGSTGVDLYNVYTGVKLTTLANVAATAGQVAFSEDGQTLFVLDTTNLKVNQINLQTSAILASYTASSPPISAPTPRGNAFVLLHPDGYPTLFTAGGRTYDLASGTQFSTPVIGGQYAESFAVSPDQSLIAPQYGDVSRIIRLVNAAVVQNDVLTLPIGTVENSDNGQACFSTSGDRIYTASGASGSASGTPYVFNATSIATGQVIQILPGAAYPDAIQCVWNGLVVGGLDDYYDPTDIYVYNGSTGAALGQLSSNGAVVPLAARSLLSRGLAVSADGTIVVSAFAVNGQLSSSVATGVYFQTLP